MKKTKKQIKVPAMLMFFLLIIISIGNAQEKESAKRDSIIAAAREIIGTLKYCALITIDSVGNLQTRTMNPFPPEDNMYVWMATSSQSQKVKDIKNNPNVCLYYANHSVADGYVSITGKAVLVDDMSEKLKRKRDYWDQAFPDWKYLILIKVIPEKMEVVNYKRGMANEPVSFKAHSVQFIQP